MAMGRFESGRMGMRNAVLGDRDRDGKPINQRSQKPDAPAAAAPAPVSPTAPPQPPSPPHNVPCALCKATIGQGVRYRCVTCANIDVCEKSRTGTDALHSRQGGKHLMFHIPNSAAVGAYVALDGARTGWTHAAWACHECKAKPITGERYYCERCAVTFCGACVYTTNHPTTHAMQLHTKPQGA